MAPAPADPGPGVAPLFQGVFALVLVGIVVGGVLKYRNETQTFQAALSQQLLAIKELKVRELARWREERLADGEVLRGNVALASLVGRMLGRTGDKAAERELRDWLLNVREAYQYNRVMLVDAQGNLRLSIPESGEPLSLAALTGAREGLRRGDVEFIDFYRSPFSDSIRLAITVPILNTSGHEALGSIILRIDPESFLYPFISNWPIPSRTAETLLIRREGNEVVFLNDLRFNPAAALALRLPLTLTDNPAVMAALGRRGMVRGRDYRSEPVTAAVGAVPDSPWLLVARIAEAEAFAPLRTRLWLTLLIVALLLAITVATAAAIWREHRARFFSERVKLVGALQDNQRLLEQAERLGKAGGWEFDIATGKQTWTDMVYNIHELEVGSDITVAQGESFYTPESRPIIELAVTRAIEQGEPFDVELEIVTAKGNRRSVHAIGSANPARRIVAGFFQDITQRKQQEAELALAVTDLERSNKELEQFAYVASHDLQEPLRMVSSYTQLLEERYEHLLDEKGRKYIHYAVDGAARMQRLIGDLLTFSQSGSRPSSLASTDSHAVLGQAVANLTATIIEQQALISNDNLPVILADAGQLEQLFQNLLSNALKFRGKDAPRIHVSAQERPGEWLFAVRDNGIGIEPQHAERVFVIFQRLHSREDYPGTGIGLALCQRIVERGGGKIWFESEPGHGTTFFFTVPK